MQWSFIDWVLSGALLVAIGLLILTQWLKARKKRIPTDWPLAPRKLFSGQEESAFQFLTKVFPDHLVMVKVPLIRFMKLKNGEDPHFWFPLISPLNVTFLVASKQGAVIGAIDLPADARTSSSVYTLKQRALQTCNIKYLKLSGTAMPTHNMLRSIMLGEGADSERRNAELFRASTYAEVDAARAKLDETLKHKRLGKPTSELSQDTIVSADTFFSGDTIVSRPR